jgi:hypothetical protein
MTPLQHERAENPMKKGTVTPGQLCLRRNLEILVELSGNCPPSPKSYNRDITGIPDFALRRAHRSCAAGLTG